LKSPGIKARSGRLPAPLHVIASSGRLHDSPADAFPHGLPETPPHGSQITIPHVTDQSVFVPVFLSMHLYLNHVLIINNYKYNSRRLSIASVPPPASPSPPSMSALSIASSSSSPQSPGHFFTHHQSNHFIFNTSTINMISATTCLPLPGGSPSAIQTPSFPNNVPSQPPPPLPPRPKRRENSCSESPQQVRL
jgi:hypothetical protein